MFKRNWVPLPVLQKALTEKCHREISLFVFLKMTTASRVKIESRKKKEILRFFSISKSTLYRRLETLREWNWVGYDELTSIYFVRGYKYIYKKEQFISRTAVRVKFEDLLQFQVFSFSASVGYLVRQQSRRKERGAERKTWRSKQSPASIYRPVAISVMETLFSISKDTIINLKKKAIDVGYLKRERGYKPLFHIKYLTPEYYTIHPEHIGKLRRDGPMIALIQPDEFIDLHIYKRKIYL